MVTPEDRMKLEEYLLPRYTPDVNKILKEKGINPDKEQPYDPGHISNVLKGKYDNPEIENAFWEIYEQRLAKKKEIAWRKNRALTDQQPA